MHRLSSYFGGINLTKIGLESSVNYQLCHGGFHGDFIISISQAIPLDRDTIGVADLLNVPLDDSQR